MRTKIVFGMALDGVRWSRGKTATVGEIVCGPMMMLKLLETRIGLSGKEASASERIRQYGEKVRTVNAAWYRASHEKDPWGVASRLLEMRDELVMMGWDGWKTGDSARISALSEIEELKVAVAPGLADRLWAVAKAPPLDPEWATVVFADNVALYPAVWKAVFARHLGAAFESRLAEDEAKLKREKDGDAKTRATRTKPELTIVTAPDEMRLAVAMARYLRAGGPTDNRNVAVVAEGDTTLLDGVLERYGLPRLGRSSSSVFREALEVTPLWIANMWKPFDPQLLVGLLSMSFGPLGRRYANVLIHALNEEPGIGGDAWRKAWDEKIPEIIDGATKWKDGVPTEKPLEDDKKAELRARVARLRSVFENDRYDPASGIPVARLLDVVSIVKERFDQIRGRLQAERHRTENASGDRMVALSVASAQVVQLAEVLKARGPGERVSKPQLDRVVASVVGYGMGQYDVHEEVSDCRFVRNPGQVVEPAGTVLWWDFTDRTSVRRTTWLESEIAGLPGCGDAELRARRDLAAWRCALESTREHLVCFVPELKDGKPSVPHPFLDNLASEYGGPKAVKAFMKTCDGLAEDGTRWKLAGRALDVVESAEPEGKRQRTPGTVPADANLKPKSFSPTQLETLVSCPYRWYLKHHLALRESDLNDLNSDPLVKGKLAHKVMEKLLSAGGGDLAPDEAGREAARLFEELVPQMAAMFDAAERKEDRRLFKRELCAAVRSFVVEVQKRNLAWEASEQYLPVPGADGKEQPQDFKGVPFSGRADLILHDKADPSRRFVVDFKWSRKNDKYDNAVKSGTALQLAAYDWLLNRGEFKSKSAYYLFPQEKYIECVQDDSATWKLLETTYDAILEKMRSGVIDKGVPDKMFATASGKSNKGANEGAKGKRLAYLAGIGRNPADWMDKAPNCDYCPFRALCGEIEEYVPEQKTEGEVQK